jgi:lactate dehydrogenase-like 2-hydroxyacid dehydrogenase
MCGRGRLARAAKQSEAWCQAVARPAIFGLVLHQTGSHWVFQSLRHSVRKTLIAAEDVIEAFILPHLAFATERFVKAMSGLAFDGVHDLRDGE